MKSRRPLFEGKAGGATGAAVVTVPRTPPFEGAVEVEGRR